MCIYIYIYICMLTSAEFRIHVRLGNAECKDPINRFDTTNYALRAKQIVQSDFASIDLNDEQEYTTFVARIANSGCHS